MSTILVMLSGFPSTKVFKLLLDPLKLPQHLPQPLRERAVLGTWDGNSQRRGRGGPRQGTETPVPPGRAPQAPAVAQTRGRLAPWDALGL